uniref:Uncharacterized protein n=1 Tax=Timema genevievae TaxID=629358 RepID=A0A7R9PJ66_TIMGE|nr:unnamed protein product [Timema genevievae]
MSHLCRQVSIESPGPTIKDCVFSFDVPMPDVPPRGARIKLANAPVVLSSTAEGRGDRGSNLGRVVCAGACYRIKRSPSLSSISSISSTSSLSNDFAQDLTIGGAGAIPQSPAHYGVRDGAIFPGYEVAGIVESLGEHVEKNSGFQIGDRVVLYPYEGNGLDLLAAPTTPLSPPNPSPNVPILFIIFLYSKPEMFNITATLFLSQPSNSTYSVSTNSIRDSEFDPYHHEVSIDTILMDNNKGGVVYINV